MRLIATLLFTLTVSLAFATEVEIKFEQVQVTDNKLYVDVEVRSQSDEFILAGQNLRAYFDTSVLAFDKSNSKSQLNNDIYSPLNIITHRENIDASRVGQLDFDKNLGFINMTIDLMDVTNGGTAISDEWVTIATLAFDIKKKNATADIVWARLGAGDAYATAFVQISEWRNYNTIVKTDVIEHTDLSYVPSKKKYTKSEGEITVGPNPTQDYIEVKQESQTGEILLIDMNGAVVVEQAIKSRSTRIDMTNLSAGNYVIYISNGTETKSEKIVKIK